MKTLLLTLLLLCSCGAHHDVEDTPPTTTVDEPSTAPVFDRVPARLNIDCLALLSSTSPALNTHTRVGVQNGVCVVEVTTYVTVEVYKKQRRHKRRDD